jgi:hypothetical protein
LSVIATAKLKRGGKVLIIPAGDEEVADDSNNSFDKIMMQSFAQHATTMFFPHFVGDACSRESHQLGKRRIRLA